MTADLSVRHSSPAPATGPLRVHPGNDRYFTDGSGRAILLAGSHTWSNFQDRGYTDPPPAFDWGWHLDWLAGFNHNFIRLWVWEQAAYCPSTPEKRLIAPLPYLRPGPALALDGKP